MSIADAYAAKRKFALRPSLGPATHEEASEEVLEEHEPTLEVLEDTPEIEQAPKQVNIAAIIKKLRFFASKAGK